MTSRPSKDFADTCAPNWRIDSSPRLQVNRSRPYRSVSSTSTAPCSTSPIHGQVSEGTSMPTTPVRPRASPTARELGTYPSSSMTLRTRAAVNSSSSPLPLSTRETVVLLTLARAATSAMVIGTCPPTCVQAVAPQFRNRFRERFRAVNSGEPGHVNQSVALFRFRDGNQRSSRSLWSRQYFLFRAKRAHRGRRKRQDRRIRGGREQAAARAARLPGGGGI